VSSGFRSCLGWIAAGIALEAMLAGTAWPHDIPNQRVDRSIQVSIAPPQLLIDYEVSLTELTLTQNLRALIGSLPGGDRDKWLAQYGQVTGPLNAKGILVKIDGQDAALEVRSYEVAVEEHPRYTFHFAVTIPAQAAISVQDTNYASSEGTSRLAVRAGARVVLVGDDLPQNVE
jgi:nickel/cobalt transporter (NicO) family protein